jgi:Trm5-related predicted tRNA methylase
MNRIIEILIKRDGYSLEDAKLALQEARDAVLNGEDPSDVLSDYFMLEPDYLEDLLWS